MQRVEPGDFRSATSSQKCLPPALAAPPSEAASSIEATSFRSLGVGASFAIGPLNKRFDDHFHVRSRQAFDVLNSGTGIHSFVIHQAAEVPTFKDRPEMWGISVRFISLLWQYVGEDLEGYAATHELDDFKHHLCLVDPCRWQHVGFTPVKARWVQANHYPMKPNMHLVVDRYVKPWTSTCHTGLGLMLNAGHIALLKGAVASDFCMAQIFISHTWNESFRDFVSTLTHTLAEESVVWVCGFSMPQHEENDNAFLDLEETPFAVAMKSTGRVLALMDGAAEALQRCWVVLEAELAQRWGKNYDISLPDNGDAEIWRRIEHQLDFLDLRLCNATQHEDKDAILSYAREGLGGIGGLNGVVQAVAKKAVRRAELQVAASSGDVTFLEQMDVGQLESFVSIRGRTITHITAGRSQVNAMMLVINRTASLHLNKGDVDGLSPLSVAAQSGALVGAQALITIRAELEIASPRTGLTALHIASAHGHVSISELLMASMANVEAKAVFKGRNGAAPLHIACLQGHASVVRILAKYRADVDAEITHTLTSPLHLAAQEGHVHAVSALLDSKADVNRPGYGKGITAVMNAALLLRFPVVSVLLTARASVNVKNVRGEDVIDYCRLRALPTPASPSYFDCGSKGDHDAMERMLEMLEAFNEQSSHSRLCKKCVIT